MQPDSLLQMAAATFAELGAADPESIRRTLLLRDRQFVGHRFQCGDLHAIWVLGSSEIEFHDRDGKLLRTVGFEVQQMKEAA